MSVENVEFHWPSSVPDAWHEVTVADVILQKVAGITHVTFTSETIRRLAFVFYAAASHDGARASGEVV